MPANISRINLIRKMPNMTLKTTYYPPKSERDIEDIFPDYSTMSLDEIKAFYSKEWVKEYGTDFADVDGESFKYKDGTEDVYTKSGYEHEIFEYLARTFINKKRYRIITDTTHVDFLAGGRILLDGHYFEIVKVINMTNDVATQNKFRGKKYIPSPHVYAPKILAII